MSADPPERRVNPYDKQAYTFQELTDHYQGRYSAEQVKELWDLRMPVVLPKLLETASEEQRRDRDFVLRAVQLRGPELRHAASELRRDQQLALAAVRQDWIALDYVAEDLYQDRDVILEGLKQDWEAITYAAAELQRDEEVAVAALNQSVMALQCIPQDLWSSEGPVRQALLAAAFRSPEPLKHCPEAIRSDREVMLKALRKNSKLDLVAPALLRDRGFALQAVQGNWEVLELLPVHYTEDREIVLAALEQSPYSLRLASQELRGDAELVLSCVQKAAGALRYAAPHLLEHKEEILAAAVRQDPLGCLRQASEALKDDQDLLLIAVAANGAALQYGSERMRNDRQVVMAAVLQCGHALEFASEELRMDREVVLTAVRQNKGAMAFACQDLRSDLEVLRTARAGEECGPGSNFPYATQVVRKLNEAPLELLKLSEEDLGKPPADLEEKMMTIGFTTIFEYLFLLRECCQALNQAGKAGVVLLAAAVSDFYVPESDMAKDKIQSRAHDGLTVQLRNVPKLLGAVRLWAPEAFVLSFKLETNPNILLAKAAGALKKYQVDAVCSNVLQTIRDWVTIIEFDSATSIEVPEITGDETEPIQVSGVSSLRLERGDNRSVDVPLVKAVVNMHSAKMSR
ncbi:unnamed protein product [Effrenium voratum]|uniref:Uncharacterized protein n=1 Tax=Effrenium voratum TaxID=2562239 RepID=A0AA36J0D7_9DINO|nr:unnamed protein product [Effrenium voratum]